MTSSCAVKRRPAAGAQAHHVEIVAADQRAPRALGGLIDGDAVGLIVLRDDVHHRRAIAEVLEIGIRPRAALPFAVLHRGNAKRSGIRGDRDRPEQHGLDPREDGGVGADAEAERQDRGERQPGILEQRPDRIANVGNQCGHGASGDRASVALIAVRRRR